MRIGLIARADNTGLGIQSKGFFDHIPCKAFVIDSSLLAPSHSDILTPHPERFPGQRIFQMQPGHGMTGAIPYDLIQEFVKDLDILFAIETPYDYNFFAACKHIGVKTILQLNYEFLDFPSNLPHPDLFASPSTWHYNDIPEVKKYLPVPVNVNHFTPVRKLKTFTHCAGRPAIHDRNGTGIFLESLNYVENHINVNLIGQIPIGFKFNRKNIHIEMQFGNKKNYFDNYTGGVLVMPRKYGGLCLPMNEAIAAEMPVITADVSPNNGWLPSEWLVPVTYQETFRAKKHIAINCVDPIQLAKKIDEFCDEEFYNSAVETAIEIKKSISWDALLPTYKETFIELMK